MTMAPPETPPSSTPFVAGVPTQPDVDRLVEAFGVPEVGRTITYQQIAEVIHEEDRSHRWKTVTHAWRRQLYREHNLLLVAIPNLGFEVANPRERVHQSSRRYKGGLRKVFFAGDIAGKTDREELSEDERRVCEHLGRSVAALRLAAATQARELKKPDPVKQIGNGK